MPDDLPWRSKRFEEESDHDLAIQADSGLRGQGSLVEMMRRLKDSLLEQAKTTNKLNTRLYWLTVAIFLFTAGMFFLGLIQLFR